MRDCDEAARDEASARAAGHRPAGFDPADADLVRAGRRAWGDAFRLRVAARATSTQDLAAAAARGGAAAGWWVVADEQSAGRGRLGRRWEAPAGTGLLASVVLRPHGPLGWVPLAAGLAVCDAVAQTCGAAPRLKWPNDVLAAGGKLAGVLAELERRGGGDPAVVLGVGLNVAVEAFPEGIPGVSLHALTAPAPPPRREALLAALISTLRARLDLAAGGEAGVAQLAADWESRATGLGERVVVRGAGEPVAGVALGLDARGALRIGTDDGAVVTVVGGVVDHAGS